MSSTKRHIAIFFTMLFVAMISAPAIISAIDDTIDISVIFSLTDEEEKEKEGKENRDIEIMLADLNKIDKNSDTLEIENNLEYFFKKYPKPHLNLISPPPELGIL